MLDCMGYARHIWRIAEAADINVQRCARLICPSLMYQQHLELVWQREDTICAIVELWSLQIFYARP